MNIGDKIKNAREENKLTQTQVSEKLLVSRQTISNWENGDWDIIVTSLRKPYK